MARRPDASLAALVEIKAVDGAYPLYGAAKLDPAGALQDALAEHDGVYGILADPNLLEVAQTIFGLSSATSASSIDSQAKTLSRLMPLSDLQDPKKLTRLVERFTAMYDLDYGPSSGATTSLTVSSGNTGSGASSAVSILSNVITANGQTIASALNAFTGATPSTFSSGLMASLAKLNLGG